MTTEGAPASSIEVVGLGPAGPDLITHGTWQLLQQVGRHERWRLYLRTNRHPAAAAFPTASTFDGNYERGANIEDVYRSIVDDLVDAAHDCGRVVYAVPGSPAVGERTVELLRVHPAVIAGEVGLVVRPALSFLEVAFERLAIDPVATGVRIVDGEAFAIDAAGSTGPLIVAQCWDRSILSAIKLAVDPSSDEPVTVTVLSHLGLPDERVWEVAWEDLDRSVDPDHLTSLWIPALAAPIARELVRLDELVRTLRERCPWDRRQTHASLRRHLLEEAYEVLEALDELAALDARDMTITSSGSRPLVQRSGTSGAGGEPAVYWANWAVEADGTEDSERAVANLEEELGDLLFQVYFHARLAAEAGRFTLADVARGIHDKLVDRHPHVFGDDVTATGAVSAKDVADNWEVRKLAEKNRTSVTEGIPAAMPALALSAKLQRKALAVGMALPDLADEAARVVEKVATLVTLGTLGVSDQADGGPDALGNGGDDLVLDGEAAVGDVLFELVSIARVLGIDPEAALRARARIFRSEIETLG